MEKSAPSSAHTPGPWRADWIGDDHGWILDSQGNYLAEIITEDECGFVVPADQQKANARLLVAAPLLAEALEYLLQQTVDMDLAYGIELTEGEAEAREKAIAAMTAAFGE